MIVSCQMIIQYYAEIAFCVNLIKFMIMEINNNASSVFQGRAGISIKDTYAGHIGSADHTI